MMEKELIKADLENSQRISGIDEKQFVPIELGVIGETTIEQNGIKIHPQPTSDPLDPLNWSRLEKHTILGIVMFKYFLFTYITTTTVPSFPELQSQFSISYSEVNWTVAIPALGLSVGPLFWTSFSDIYGRRTIFITGTAIALVSTIGVAVADNYSGYMAARFFQGFGVSPAATVGMAVVNDLFFDYERGQKLGLWVLAIDSGLLLGPTFGGFLNVVSAAWINWFNAILFAALLVLELFLMPETLYPRTTMLQRVPREGHKPPTSSDIEQSPVDEKTENMATAAGPAIPRTKELGFFNVKPVPGMRHPKPWDSVVRFVLTFRFPVVAISVIGYCFLWYWWILSVITMVPAAYASYTPLIQGLLFLGLFLGTVTSEICCSGRLSDYLVGRLAKRNGSVRVAEMRLWLAYPAILVTAVGLVVWGVSIDKNYHWIVGQVAFFLFAAGIQMGNTVTSSYIIDSYPLQSTSVINFYAVFLNLSAFINPFFIAQWQAATGYTWTFTTQALIVAVGGTAVFALLHWFGASMRKMSPVPSWVNPEFDSGI
ncbi:hypothetical protein CNMCM6069_002551 [Aspergillus lentulus]|nr:hypothetical protein CNMCM6069_002551 [Aspergillus lentulus]KAF4171870.1 hypothetical protein CNMCM8060_002298 [Aspergillus lentulus]KAF4178634.1 hypothetical protein CNMCM7927_002403 [Aspergillus lentulus]KAF4191424.1 hypothetical protein CNMCM8694_001824 [Aspergillus lentulus]